MGSTTPALRWYLDYCCRDDYGAGSASVSAWAGLHYFASRHGFNAAGDADGERDAVLTWPDGNAWLVQRLSEPLRERWHAGCVVQRVDARRHDVALDVWNAGDDRVERWTAAHAVVAMPLFVAARMRRRRRRRRCARPRRASRMRHGWSPTCICASR